MVNNQAMVELQVMVELQATERNPSMDNLNRDMECSLSTDNPNMAHLKLVAPMLTETRIGRATR